MGKFGWLVTLLAVCGVLTFVWYYMGTVAIVIVGVALLASLLLVTGIVSTDDDDICADSNGDAVLISLFIIESYEFLLFGP